jgi:Adenylate and Guanylate cyclase catalytic domain
LPGPFRISRASGSVVEAWVAFDRPVYKIRDGREIPVLFSSAVMQQGTSAVQGVVFAAHDLTEIKASEARGAFVRETFGRYISDDVVASLLSSADALKLGGELRKVTVMMSDLRGFTALAERLTPEEAIRFLNGYLQTMVDLILHYGGTINEIMGDGILVIFGAPKAAADDTERAVARAVAMQLAMDEVNARGRERGLPEVEMGIGYRRPHRRGDRRQHRLGPADEVRRRRNPREPDGPDRVVHDGRTDPHLGEYSARGRVDRHGGAFAQHRAEGCEA